MTERWLNDPKIRERVLADSPIRRGAGGDRGPRAIPRVRPCQHHHRRPLSHRRRAYRAL